MVPTVQIRVDIGGADIIPHTFIVVTGPNGQTAEYGLAPLEPHSIAGEGNVYQTGANGVDAHEYDIAAPARRKTKRGQNYFSMEN